MAKESGLNHRYSPEFIFAHEFTTHYDEFAQYLPEFGRLRELSRFSVLIRMLSSIHESNQEKLEALHYLVQMPAVPPPNTEIYTALKHDKEQIQNRIRGQFNEWRQNIRREIALKLEAIKTEILQPELGLYSQEVQEECHNWHKELRKANPHVSSSRLWDEVINPQRATIAQKVQEARAENMKRALYEAFSERLLPHYSRAAYKQMIDEFMSGDSASLEKALIAYDIKQAQNQILTFFPHSSIEDIALGLSDESYDNILALGRITQRESNAELKQIIDAENKLKLGFEAIHFKTQPQPVDLKKQCLWVPASVRHEVKKDAQTGLQRYSFFVYGGVNIQPRINQVRGNGTLPGNPVGSGAFNRDTIRKGFQDHHIISPTNKATNNHELLQLAGLKNLDSRVNRILLPTYRVSHEHRTLHRGRHTQEAMNDVRKKMDFIVEEGKSKNWNESRYREELHVMLAEERSQLRAGKIDLNKAKRDVLPKWMR